MWWVEKWLAIILGVFLILIVVLWLATPASPPAPALHGQVHRVPAMLYVQPPGNVVKT